MTSRVPFRTFARSRAAALSMISVGDKIPMDGEFMVYKDGPTPVPVKDFFAGKKVVLFGVPGALTPTCAEKHLPGYMKNLDTIKGKGVDSVVCMSVNDPFVMNVWAKQADTAGKIDMVCDGNAAFTEACGLGFDTGGFGGVRCTRMSMLVDDGTVKAVNVEEGGAFTEGAAPGSSAEHMVTLL